MPYCLQVPVSTLARKKLKALHTKSIHSRKRHRSLGGRAVDRIAVPSEDRSERAECEVEQEEREVLDAEVLGKHEDEATNGCYGKRVDEEPEAVLHAIRKHRVAKAVDHATVSLDLNQSNEFSR